MVEPAKFSAGLFPIAMECILLSGRMILGILGRLSVSRPVRTALMKPKTIEDINVTEILDRVLDNGIVVDPSARVYLMANELRAAKGRMVVESIQKYL